MKTKWTDSEIAQLIAFYNNQTGRELQSAFPERTWDAIKLKARQLNLSFTHVPPNNMKVLLDGSMTSWYWLGFILADGHVETRGKLIVTLALKDVEHLNKLAGYINATVHENHEDGKVTVAIMDAKSASEIRGLFQVNHRKTYNGAVVPKSASKEQLMALFVGFCDGDGSIGFVHKRQDCALRIKLHESWKPFLNQLITEVFRYCGCKSSPSFSEVPPRYTSTIISDNTVLRFIKSFALLHELPMMERKWGKIDENAISRYVTASKRIQKTKKYLKKNMRKSDMAIKLDMDISSVYRLIKRNNLSS